MKYLILLFAFLHTCTIEAQIINTDDILGNWITPKNDLIVNCYKVKNQYFGKIVWFKHYGDLLPDENYVIPQEKWINYIVMKNFEFKDNEWSNGEILEVKKGKKYDSYIKLVDKKTLSVTGYFIFKFISESQVFYRYDEAKLPAANNAD